MSPLTPEPGLTVMPDARATTLGDPYLNFALEPGVPAAFALSTIQEVVSVASQRLAAIPNMPLGMLGLIGRRGRALWIVDLPVILGLSPQAIVARQRLTVAVARVPTSAAVQSHVGQTRSEFLLGLVIPQLRGTIRFPSEAIYSMTPGDRHAHWAPLLRGCVDWFGQQVLILDGNAIAQSLLAASG